MKPLDPRLLRHAAPAKRYIILVAITGAITAGLVIAQAFLISGSISPIIDGTSAPAAVLPLVFALIAVLVARAAVTWVQEAYGHRAAIGTMNALREKVLARAATLGPRWLAEGNTNQVVTFTSRGLDDLEPYFVKYLPQLLLAVTVTPATLAVVLILDWISALLIVFCIPIIPVFMILIGKMTESKAERKLRAMEHLGSQLLDLLAGLTTLKALGREQGPKRRVAELGDSYRRTTMDTLRIAFLSGAVLEFLATLSTALVAVEVGFRMVYGHLDLMPGLVIIMLTPEVFKPLREVGSQYHASTDGIAAANEAFEILETPAAAAGTRPAPDLTSATIEFDALSIDAPGRATIAPFNLSAAISPGRVTALMGPSGSGKTTAANALLGLVHPSRGGVVLRTADGERVDLAEVDPDSLWRQVSWVAQRPAIVPGTVAKNTDPEQTASAAALSEAAQTTGFDSVIAGLPEGWDTIIGQGGVGLSVGQRQRLALTRALISDAPLVILDEPTAHLDARSEDQIVDAVRRLREDGRTVLVIAHRQALVAVADDVVMVESASAEALA